MIELENLIRDLVMIGFGVVLSSVVWLVFLVKFAEKELWQYREEEDDETETDSG